MHNDIAIVGMAVEVPDAADILGFWDIVRAGRSLTRPFPMHRRPGTEEFIKYARTTTVYEQPDEPIMFHNGSFLETPDSFDPAFFGMTPKQASTTDPHHRMVLRTMYLALENAGYTGPRLAAQRTGVFVGYASNPSQSYLDYYIRIDPSLGKIGLTGNVTTMMANRLSHYLNLHGPSMVVDTACSASLVAVHQAKNALLVGDCEMAVVGGARIVGGPVKHPQNDIGIESSDGATRTLDDRADGTGFGEGSGSVVLKRLDRAVADGDFIYAVIKGSAVNHDGATDGMTTPDSDSQAELLSLAWANAEVDPRSVGYIELHGTATRIGDPIEFEGLRRAFARYTEDRRFCAVGTVKANIGHLYEGSGVMGLIKAAMTLHTRTIPRLAGFERPNRAIDFDDSPAYVPTATGQWRAETWPRRAGVSAFGLGGTNCHVVLEEYAETESITVGAPSVGQGAPTGLFCLSARTERSLRAMLERFATYLSGERAAQLDLLDVCHTAAVSRSRHQRRIAMVVGGVEELATRLAALAGGDLAAAGTVYGNLETLATAAAPEDVAGEPGRLAAVASAYVGGADLDPATVLGSAATDAVRKIVWLPGYVFDERRCWIEFPNDWRERFNGPLNAQEQAAETTATHQITFEPVETVGVVDPDAKVLALVDRGTGAEDMLRAAGLLDLRVLRLGTRHRQEAEKAGSTAGTGEATGAETTGSAAAGATSGRAETADEFWLDEAGVEAVAELVAAQDFTHVVYAVPFERRAVADTGELEQRIDKNLYGLFRLLKALMGEAVRVNVRVLTHTALAVGDGRSAVATENATLAGLVRGSNREYPSMPVKLIDIDESVTPEQVAEQILAAGSGVFALRGGQCHREHFSEVAELEPALGAAYLREDGSYLRPGGTYLITGGTGAIGLSTAAMFSTLQPDIALVLLSRSGVPEAERWDDILTNDPGGRQAGVLRTVRECQQRGTTVEVMRVDVGDVGALTAAVTGIQGRYGRIDGIVHAAGIPSRHIIAHRPMEDFESVVRPKVHAAFVMDSLTSGDRPDFVVYFSSVAAVFPAGGQADYAAANYYLDNLAAANTDKACHVLTLDWVAWKEIGMAADTGANVDTTFRAISTERGLAVLDAALRSDRRRVFGGQMHYEGDIVGMLKSYDVALDTEILDKIDSAAQAREERQRRKAERTKREIRSVEVELAGRPDGEYTDLERLLAQCWAHSFGYEEIDVTADFFDLGGDSIMAISLIGNLSECLDTQIEAADLLMERTIEGFAQTLEMSYGIDAELQAVQL